MDNRLGLRLSPASNTINLATLTSKEKTPCSGGLTRPETSMITPVLMSPPPLNIEISTPSSFVDSLDIPVLFYSRLRALF